MCTSGQSRRQTAVSWYICSLLSGLGTFAWLLLRSMRCMWHVYTWYMHAMRRVITGAAITPACLSLCRISALGFVSPALQQPRSGHRRQQQLLPTPGRGTAAAAAVAAAVAPLSGTLPWPPLLLLLWPFANSPWDRKADEDEASPLGSQGSTLFEMSSPSDDRHHPSAIRNRGFISEELSKWEGSSGGSEGDMLDIASGTGCHVEAFAKALPGWTFQPSEYDETRLPEITNTIERGGFTNILPPKQLDVRDDPAAWPRPPTKPEGGGVALWDAAMCINMIHIAPQECTPGLLKGAAAGLKMGKRLFLYGPFGLDGALIPDSNKSFDESLKARSQGLWGIRDVAWVAELAGEEGLELTAMTHMPANNFFVVFTKVRDAASSNTDETSSDVRASRVAERVSAVARPAWEALVASVAGN